MHGINKDKPDQKWKSPLIDTAITASVFAISTGVCFLLNYFRISDLNFLIIYVLGILVTAILTKGIIYSSVLSVVSVFGCNFFFTEPRYTFHFNDKMYVATFILMFAVGIVTSFITAQWKRRMSQVNALNIEKEQLKSNAEKEQLKATLLRSISHDLRTPLTTIKNGAELLIDNPNIDEKDKNEILSDIATKSAWMVRLVENLLSLSRIDSEKLTVNKSPEALEEIIPQAVRNIQGILERRKIHYDLPSDFMLIPMDATLIIQTIVNILTNAVRHTADDGNIWIKVWNTGKHAVFRFTNDGEHISEKDLPHIFEMYYTSGDCKHGKGVGIGLAVCKLIVTAHGVFIRGEEVHLTNYEYKLLCVLALNVGKNADA